MDIQTYNKNYLSEKKPTLCPRCGISPLDKEPSRNALSRHEQGIHICSSCGTDEALRDYAGNKLEIEHWAVTHRQ